MKWLSVFVVLCVFVSPSVAQNSRVVGSLSARSLNDLVKVARELGVELPAGFTPAGIRAQYRGVGPAVRPNRPVGIYIVAGVGVPFTKTFMWALPVRPGTATLTYLNSDGGRYVTGHTDTLIYWGWTLRRTQHYALIGGTLDAILSVRDSTLTSQYRSSSAVARLQIDVKALRQVAPHLMTRFLKSMNLSAPPKGADPVQAYFRKLIAEPIRDDIDGVELQFDRTSRDWRVAMKIKGFEPWTRAYLQRPKIPGTVVGRMDVVYPDKDKAAWPREFTKQIFNLTPGEHAPAMQPIITDAVESLLVGEGLTYAVTEIDGKFVVFVVQQYRRSIDLKSRVKSIIDSAEQLAGGSDETRFLADLTYATEDGAEVTRLHVLSGGQPWAYIDMIQHKRMIVTAMSLDSGRYLPKALPVKVGGRISTGAVGWVDPYSMVQAIQSLPDNPFAGINKYELNKTTAKLRNRKINFSAGFERDWLTFEVTIPENLADTVRATRDLIEQ
jgi:hypothetical protein